MTLRLTRAQVREVDRLSIEKYHVPGIVLMENAARAVVDVAMEMVTNIAKPSIAIMCGGGNNGGDGLAIARHLHNRGAYVSVGQAWSSEPTGDAAINLRIVRAMSLTVVPPEHLDSMLEEGFCELLIDSLFGTGLSRPIEAPLKGLVEAMQTQPRRPILAIDLPSGLDCDTGEPLGACVRATKTVTFVAEKAGFANPAAKEYTGDVIVGDIGCPREVIEEVRRVGC